MHYIPDSRNDDDEEESEGEDVTVSSLLSGKNSRSKSKSSWKRNNKSPRDDNSSYHSYSTSTSTTKAAKKKISKLIKRTFAKHKGPPPPPPPSIATHNGASAAISPAQDPLLVVHYDNHSESPSVTQSSHNSGLTSSTPHSGHNSYYYTTQSPSMRTSSPEMTHQHQQEQQQPHVQLHLPAHLTNSSHDGSNSNSPTVTASWSQVRKAVLHDQGFIEPDLPTDKTPLVKNHKHQRDKNLPLPRNMYHYYNQQEIHKDESSIDGREQQQNISKAKTTLVFLCQLSQWVLGVMVWLVLAVFYLLLPAGSTTQQQQQQGNAIYVTLAAFFTIGDNLAGTKTNLSYQEPETDASNFHFNIHSDNSLVFPLQWFTSILSASGVICLAWLLGILINQDTMAREQEVVRWREHQESKIMECLHGKNKSDSDYHENQNEDLHSSDSVSSNESNDPPLSPASVYSTIEEGKRRNMFDDIVKDEQESQLKNNRQRKKQQPKKSVDNHNGCRLWSARFFVCSFLLACNAVILYFLAQVEEWDIATTIAYGVRTATTVGYDNSLIPQTDLGRCLAIAFMPLVVGLTLLVVESIITTMIHNQQKRQSASLFQISAANNQNEGANLSESEFVEFMLVATNQIDPDVLRRLKKRYRACANKGINRQGLTTAVRMLQHDDGKNMPPAMTETNRTKPTKRATKSVTFVAERRPTQVTSNTSSSPNSYQRHY